MLLKTEEFQVKDENTGISIQKYTILIKLENVKYKQRKVTRNAYFKPVIN